MKYKITLKLCNEYYFFTILHINIYVKKLFMKTYHITSRDYFKQKGSKD